MEEQQSVGDKLSEDRISKSMAATISTSTPSDTQQSPQSSLLTTNASFEQNSNGNVPSSQGTPLLSALKRKYVRKTEVEDSPYVPSTSMVYKRRRKRRVPMGGGLLEGGVKGARPVNERNIERVLDRSLQLTESMLQLLLASKDDLKRLCGVGAGGVSSGGVTTSGGGGLGGFEGLTGEKQAKMSNNKKLMEIVDKINKAYVEYHTTIDDLAELGKGEGGEDDDDDGDDDDYADVENEDDDDDDEYQVSKAKWSRHGNGAEGVKKRPYHRRQPYNRKQVKVEATSYHSSDGSHGNHRQAANDSHNSSYFSSSGSKNNQSHDADSVDLENRPWQIKKEKPWDWPEEKGHDLDPNVSNDLVMTCEPGSDDESLYNVGFPKFNRNY